MESGTDTNVSNPGRVSYFEALKLVAMPLGSVVGVLAVVFWFAGNAWVRTIVQEEIMGISTGTSDASTLLTQHELKLEQHEVEIDDNEDGIEKVDDKFTRFVSQVIEKL